MVWWIPWCVFGTNSFTFAVLWECDWRYAFLRWNPFCVTKKCPHALRMCSDVLSPLICCVFLLNSLSFETTSFSFFCSRKTSFSLFLSPLSMNDAFLLSRNDVSFSLFPSRNDISLSLSLSLSFSISLSKHLSFLFLKPPFSALNCLHLPFLQTSNTTIQGRVCLYQANREYSNLQQEGPFGSVCAWRGLQWYHATTTVCPLETVHNRWVRSSNTLMLSQS